MTKICTKCWIEKDIFLFSKNKKSKDGYCCWCKECSKKNHKKYYSLHKKEIINNVREWVLKNPDRRKENLKKYNNSEKTKKKHQLWSNLNRDKINKNSRKFSKNNRDKRNALWEKHRADKLDRTPPWITPEMKKDIEFFYKICSEMINPKDWNVDHIIPLQGKLASGLHVPQNLQLLESGLNFRKHNKFEPTCETFNPPIKVDYIYRQKAEVK
jgi:hypothetical protein